ncbi:prepilin-type N-terminal cleavage/methylation domain-containing protein [Pelagibacteraceae bacterium]|nr:prepilin-type N-terminal cleavage/methylation domain-containing protein [Pelagibacteraceae bacterium]
MPGHHKNGFSLVEMLIALAVSAIIIAAAFGSYAMIARNFDFQKDMKYIAQSARAVVDMVNSDIRLAGYTAVDNGAITDAVMLSDSGTATCCDAISVVYDQTPTERRQVTYYTKQYTSDDTRFRLYKHICQVTSPLTIAEIQAGQCPATATLLAENPIADYVEDLQFSGTRGTCDVNAQTPGCGKTDWYSADNDNWPSDDWRNFPIQFVPHAQNNRLPCGGASNLKDGDITTNWTCNGIQHGARADYAVTGLGFNSPVKIQKVRVGTYNPDSANNAWSGNASIYRQKYILKLYGSNKNGNNWGSVIGQYGNTVTTQIASPPNSSPIVYPVELNVNGFTDVNFVSILVGKFKSDIYHSSGQYNGIWMSGSNQVAYLPEIEFYYEKFPQNLPPFEVESSILIRSPNEHGNVDRSVGSPLTLGNRTNSWSDKHLRDSFTTATVVRNLYYSSQ